MSRTVLLVLVTLFRLSTVYSQAPGDEDHVQCVDSSTYRHTYPDNVKILMDSWNYEQLLPGHGDQPIAGAVWTDASCDNNDHAQFPFITPPYWQHGAGGICRWQAQVCGYIVGDQNNWLFTQHISKAVPAPDNYTVRVFVNITYTFQTCRTRNQCNPQFRVLKYISNSQQQPKRDSCSDTSLYSGSGIMPSNTVETDGTDGVASDLRYFDMSTSEDGLYLALQDVSAGNLRGTCVGISRLIVYHHQCPAQAVGLVRYPATQAPVSGTVSIQTQCVDNAITINTTATCDSNGNWGPDNATCLCKEGYEEQTHSGEQVCQGPPSAPLNVSVSSVTNTSAVLSWLPPEDDGGRDRSEIYYTVTATGTGASVSVEATVNVTMTEVTGLTPFTDYTFSVTSENTVSSQATDTSSRTSTNTATTLEGVAGTVVDIERTDSSRVNWSPPSPPNGVIIFYNIRITHLETGELERFVEVFNNTSIDISDYVDPDGNYNVQVQAVTVEGPGNFSSPVTVTIGENKESNNSVVVGVVVAIVVVIILLMISLVAGLLTAYRIRYRRLTKALHIAELRKKNINDDAHIYEVPDIKSAPPLPPRTQQSNACGISSQEILKTTMNTAYDNASQEGVNMTINIAYDTCS